MTPEEQINTAWRRGYEAGQADGDAWRAWDAAGRPGKLVPTRPPYDTGWLYMPWLDGYGSGGDDARAAAGARAVAARAAA